MSTLILENNWLKATFKISGAELSSLVSKTNNTEHIWQADPAIWNRHTPILFPIVGQVENNSYSFEGVEYKMSQHGFARDKEFKIESHTADKIVFSLESNDETLKNYPFGFKLFITYTLILDQLKITYNVANTDLKIIYFSIGAHPGLICPFQENENFEDYILEFEKPEIATRHFFADGLLNVANGVGVGVVSARETAPLVARTRAAKEITTLGNSPDPPGLTLSSIRQKSLYR